MRDLTEDYFENKSMISEALRLGENFDVLEKKMIHPGGRVVFYYIDGFVKDGELQRVMQTLLSLGEPVGAKEMIQRIPYFEVSRTSSFDEVLVAVLSGQTVMLAESFGGEAVILDLRTYPARGTEEPEGDRVMQGARDGFVETLIMNTALLRRRIRDPNLTMLHFEVGEVSHTDVVVSYMKGVADDKYVKRICRLIEEAKPKALTLGAQSLAEVLIKRRWYNPFPKIRTTERPDTAASQVLEGSVLIFCDTSPLVMILPTTIFDFFEEADDYCFPPLTGTYLRLIRIAILILSVISTPLWYLAVEYGAALPDFLLFLLPDDRGALPIILQLFLAELAIDGLKLASMNTPNMLSNSLSVVGGLLLGDFAVDIGWFSSDVIFYMACVTIANFAQQNHELGYAFKFMRMLTLGLVYLFGFPGFIMGIIALIIFVSTNATVNRGRSYLYPLIPFRGRAMKRHIFRTRKRNL